MKTKGKSTRFTIILALVIMVLSLLIAGIVSAKDVANDAPDTAPTTQTAVDNLMADSNNTATLTMNQATDVVRFASFPQGLHDFSLRHVNDVAAKRQADAFLASYGAAFGLEDAATELVHVDTVVDNFGFTHVNYTEVIDGVDVYASTMRVHFNKDGQLTAVNGTIVPDIKANAQPKVTPTEAEQIAVNEIAKQNAATVSLAAQDSKTEMTAVDTHLYFYNTGLVQSKPGITVLAYEVEVSNGNDVREFLFVDAQNGSIVAQFSGIHEGVGSDREISETSLGNVVWDESNSDPDPIPPGWAGGTAQQVTDWQNEIDGSDETYNTIDNLTGGTYSSYDGAEATMRTVNNDPGISCPNANWNGVSTNYCTNVTGDDTVAHEWGHAYTEYTHGLIYAWQPGALNESYSDIWGEVVDLINGRGTDSPGGLRTDGACSIFGSGSPSTDNTYRWLSGEDDPAFGGAIRDMWQPNCYGDPGKVSDTQYWCAATDGGGVHTNSGVPNHAFALLVDGGTYNGQTITGIGLDKAAHIYWRAQSVYQSPSSDFMDHASAIAQSCTDLTGPPITALSSAYNTSNPTASITAGDCAELAKVITAVEFNTPPTQCGFEPAFEAAPPLCENQGTGVVNSIYTQTWESGAGAWVTGTHDIANPSSFDNPDWVIRGSLPDGRLGNAMYVEDSINRGACTAADTVAGALNLDSPTFTVPAGVTITRASIDHLVATESGWDGGNVKINVNGGGWAVLPDSAFDVNGYFAPGALNGVGAGNDNPLAGEEAFTGGGEGSLSSGWGQSQLNLLGYVTPGDNFQLRFDMGLDGCNGVDGWYVDDFEVYACEGEASLAICGDGILDAGETCDDGNTNNGDGCSDTCQTESGWSCEDPVPGNPNGTNMIADWSFEAGVPNPDWALYSTSTGISGFPLCGSGNGCPAAGVTVSGDWAVWIGGVATGVTSSVTQTVNIPSTALTMTVPTLRGVCDDPSDTLYVRIDGNAIGSLACNAVDPDFVTQTLSLAPYNDDSDHLVYIGGTVGGTNGTHSNFFVDDVTIFDNVATPDMPSVCTPTVSEPPLACGVTIGFDYGIPSDWTVVDDEGNGVEWSDIAGSGESGNFTNGTGDAASVSSDVFGSAEFDTWLVTPVFTLTNYVSTTLDYTANYQNFASSDFLDVDITTDGGATWTTLLSWNEDHGDFRAKPGEDVSLDLSAYDGMGGLQLRWRYYDPNSGDYDWYAQVDDVALNCMSINPTIEVTPENLTSVQFPDAQMTQTLTISNLGINDLDWTIDEVADVVFATTKEYGANVVTDNVNRVGTAESASADVVAQIVSNPQADVIVDGGFEAGPSGGTWTEASSNFGTPICDVAGCGTGTGTGPHSGTYWTWFGGIGAYEEGSVSQSVTIPNGTATLTFWLEQIVCDSASDYMEVTIDGTQVFLTDGSSPLCGVLGYAQQSVDVSAYADGGSHTLEFHSEIFGTNGSGSNFFVDDVALDAISVCGSPADMPWLALSPTSGTTTGSNSDDVEVTFDSTGLTPNTYTGSLCVNSNDPDTPQVAVPVTMTVSASYAVALSGDDAMSGEPGEVVTYTLTITNDGNVMDTFNIAISGESWTTTAPGSVMVNAGTSSTFDVAVTIPANAGGGDSDVATITVTSANDAGATDSADLTTTANNVYSVDLSGDDAMSDEPGEVVTYTLTITNNGNVMDTFNIAISGESWTTTAPASVMVNAGASSTFAVAVTIPAGANDADSDTATVTVTSANDAGATDSADLTTTAVILQHYLFLPVIMNP